MKDRFEVRMTIATDSLISESTIKVVAKTIETIAKKYEEKIERLVEAAVKDLEKPEVKE